MNKGMKTRLLELVPKTAYNYDRVIILENSNGLHYDGAASAFREKFLIPNKIRHHVVYNVRSLALEEVARSCLGTLVVFETTGVTESFRALMSIFLRLTNEGYNFRFIECSRYRFQLYRIPEEAGGGCVSYHNLECYSDSDLKDWELTELERGAP
jgi:hypothetical protein